MDSSCAKHPHEKGVAVCRRCGGSWCNDCLVYAFGAKKPPFCMGCAMVAGGVRTSGAARPAMPKRELKALQKAAKAEAKAAAKAAKDGPATAPEEEHVAAASEVTPTVTASSGWETPWWEDGQDRLPTFAD